MSGGRTATTDRPTRSGSMPQAVRYLSRSAPGPECHLRSVRLRRMRCRCCARSRRSPETGHATHSATLPVISLTSAITVPISAIDTPTRSAADCDLSDLGLDLRGEIRRLRRQCLDLVGDDGETASGIARPRRLDRRIQRQEVGLAGDRVDRLDDIADAGRNVPQHVDAAGSFGHALDRAPGDVGGTLDIGAHFARVRKITLRSPIPPSAGWRPPARMPRRSK